MKNVGMDSLLFRMSSCLHSTLFPNWSQNAIDAAATKMTSALTNLTLKDSFVDGSNVSRSQAVSTPTYSSPNFGQTLAGAAANLGIDFGAAVNSRSLMSNPKYAETLAGQFNSVTAENEMKWGTIQPSRGNYNFGPADEIVDFATKNGMNVRGHTLVWHEQLAGWAQNLKGEELGSVMEDHITKTAGHFKGKVKAWDVVNEAVDVSGNGENGYRKSPFYNELGKDYIKRAFKAARAADPDAELAINDFNVEGMNAKSDKLYEIVKDLKAEGLVDAVGIQAHLSGDGNPSPDEVRRNLQRFADLGVKIHITELDIGQKGGPEQQKQQYHDYIKAFTSNPAVTSITTWGVDDSTSWRSKDSPLLFDGNFKPKPAYDGVMDALTSQKAVKFQKVYV